MTTLQKQILELRSQGSSYNQIVSKLGCSKSTVAYHCGEGQKDKTLARSKDTRYKRLEAVAKIKDVPCLDCNNYFPTECMDFDHVRGNKVASISHLIAHGTWQDILDEVAKCEVVCANCHRTRTKKRGNAGWSYMT